MAMIDFGGVKEEVVMRSEFPMEKARRVLRDEVIEVIGYGVQGPAQALNLKDNGFNVIVGQAKAFRKDWNRAKKDGWVPGKTLFDVEEAAKQGTIIQYLVSDAAQKALWPTIKRCLNPGDALYFSHGFSIVYKDLTKVVPPKNIDVIMVAPKGSGTSVRRNFLSGAGINSSFAVEQDATGRARERCLAVGIGVGSGYLFPTTFQGEVFSDLTGARPTSIIAVVVFGILLGIAGLHLTRDDPSRGAEFRSLVETAQAVVLNLVRMVISLTPYGVFALMLRVSASSSGEDILNLLSFVVASYLAIIVMFAVHALIIAGSGTSPASYFKKAWPVLAFAFTSRSSAATIPLNVETQVKELGVAVPIANLSASFGATIGQNGCAGIYPAMLAVMIAPSMGVNPMDLTPKNVANFTRQLRRIGGMFDWKHTVNTSEPDYYKWTQWIFIQLFKAGLAERKEAPVNW